MDKGTSAVEAGQQDDSGTVLAESSSWIDRLTPDELEQLDEFDRRMVLDELGWRRKRLAEVEEEKTLALAGAVLVANDAGTKAAAAYEKGVADGVVRRHPAPPTQTNGSEAAHPMTSLDAAFREIVRTVVRTELGDGLRMKAPPPPEFQEDSTRKLLSIPEVAKLANVDPQTVRVWMRDGDLRFVALGKHGKTIRIRVSDYDDFLVRKAARTAKKVDLDDLATDILRKQRHRRTAAR